MFLNHFLNFPLHGMALWHMLFVQKSQGQSMVYIWATHQAFKHPSCWEPWKDNQIPAAQFHKLFCMLFANFIWLSEASRQAPERFNWLHVTIGQVFNISTETADKAAGLFVNAVLNILKKQAAGYELRLVHFNSCPPLERANQWDEIKESFHLCQGIPMQELGLHSFSMCIRWSGELSKC
ncbi:hypothetical protein VP01_1993g5 [Puccinia sorghi]|uniref:Uncharacterized protein n=1 Tax=Puccinia sorghi TaxID=27349 RepID=A0A0L6VDF1_9BASI|nr:hypothetical protein VP01_1993g5 [Puccinia sorghi]